VYLLLGGTGLGGTKEVKMKRIFEAFKERKDLNQKYDALRYGNDRNGKPKRAMGSIKRGDSEGTNRGRKEVRGELVHTESARNPNAGIASLKNTPKEAEGFFPHAINHAKSLLEKDYDQDEDKFATVQAFEDAGAPFIGGGSGSASDFAFSLLVADTEGVGASYPPIVTHTDRMTKAAKQDLLVVAGAMLVAGGHHSWAEVALAYRAFGFLQFPDPLEDYPAFMRRLEELALPKDT
jgi:hypothetical protein